MGVGTLQLQGTAAQLIRQLDTPEKCAEFWVEAQEPYNAVGEVMRHAKSLLMLGAKEGPIQVGAKYVSAEPNEYSYDIAAVKELAPECIKTVEVATSDKMQSIHAAAGELMEMVLAWEGIDVDQMEELIRKIVKQSQPEMLEAVDANKLRGILGRGDARAQKLMERRVKTPTSWKLVIKEGADAGS